MGKPSNFAGFFRHLSRAGVEKGDYLQSWRALKTPLCENHLNSTVYKIHNSHYASIFIHVFVGKAVIVFALYFPSRFSNVTALISTNSCLPIHLTSFFWCCIYFFVRCSRPISDLVCFANLFSDLVKRTQNRKSMKSGFQFAHQNPPWKRISDHQNPFLDFGSLKSGFPNRKHPSSQVWHFIDNANGFTFLVIWANSLFILRMALSARQFW